jgi:hypothetical protein
MLNISRSNGEEIHRDFNIEHIVADQAKLDTSAASIPYNPMVIKLPPSMSLAIAFISSTSQFAYTNLPFRNLASGLVSQTEKSAGSATNTFC